MRPLSSHITVWFSGVWDSRIWDSLQITSNTNGLRTNGVNLTPLPLPKTAWISLLQMQTLFRMTPISQRSVRCTVGDVFSLVKLQECPISVSCSHTASKIDFKRNFYINPTRRLLADAYMRCNSPNFFLNPSLLSSLYSENKWEIQ